MEDITIDLQASKDVVLSTESFSEMRCLRLLQMNAAHVTGCYEHFSKELAWLCWHQCPLKSLPQDFQLNNLVVLDMQYNNIREFWRGSKYEIYNMFLFLNNIRVVLAGCVSGILIPFSLF